jgi:hypothetical protein
MKKIAKSRITQMLLVLAVFSLALVLSSNQRTQAQAGGSGRTSTCSTGANTTFLDIPFYDFFNNPNDPISSIGTGAGMLTFDRIITVNFTGWPQNVMGITTGCGTDGCTGTTFGTGNRQINRWFNICNSVSTLQDTCRGDNARITVQEVAFYPYQDNGGCTTSDRLISLRDLAIDGCGATCLGGSRTVNPPDTACIIVDAFSSCAIIEFGQRAGTAADCGTGNQLCGAYAHYRVRIECTTDPTGAC